MKDLKKLKKLGTVYTVLAMLNACTVNTAGNFCLIYEPVYMDYDKDTPDTIKQVDKNNVVYEELCK